MLKSVFSKSLNLNFTKILRNFNTCPIDTFSKSEKIGVSLNQIRVRGDKLDQITPNIEYLFGKSNEKKFNKSDEKTTFGLDITDKTQLILQSIHPVRFLIEREIKQLQNKSLKSINYFEWITVFGRSLLKTNPELNQDLFEQRIETIGKAVECGMFSSVIHQSIVNIQPMSIQQEDLKTHFNMGNKYAVLVGDYFAIKCIYFTEKAKNSNVFLCLVRGVEDFTSASFATNLFNSEISYPFLPSKNATVEDWEIYNEKFAGYFAGGFQAINLLAKKDISENEIELNKYIKNMIMILKIVEEIEQLFQDDKMMISPLIFTTLPAILYQRNNPNAFREMFEKGNQFDTKLDNYIQLRDDIRNNQVLFETIEMLKKYAENAKESFMKLGIEDTFYSGLMLDLITMFSHTESTSIEAERRKLLVNQ